jgi:type I restriction enzyme S subunit
MEKKLPNNWVETDFKTVVTYQKGKKPKVLKDEPFVGSAPYLDIKAFEKDVIQRHGDIESSNLIEEDSIGIVWDGARSGWVGIGKYGAVGSTIAILKPTLVDSYYTYRFLQSKFDYLNTNTRGTGIPHVDPQILWKIQFPLPPLPEQKRIVAKLDGLFAHLEKVKSKISDLPTILGHLKQKLLTQAFKGKLTKNWRTENSEKDWSDFKMNDLINGIQAGKNFKCPEIPVQEGKVGLVKISAVTWGEFDPMETKTVEDETKIKSEYFINKGDFLISRANTIELVGASVIVKEIEHDIMISDKVWRVSFKNDLHKSFVNYYLKSRKGRQEIETRASGNQASMRNLSQNNFKEIPVPIPSDEEIKEILKILEFNFNKLKKIESSLGLLTNKVNRMPGAFLDKAFKGQLVEQLSTDGHAKDLLKEIKSNKTDANK